MLCKNIPNCCTAKIITNIPLDIELKNSTHKKAFREQIKAYLKYYNNFNYKLLQAITTNKQQIAADILRKEFNFRGNLIPSRIDKHNTTIQLHYYIYK